jgi:Acyltransferase family/Ankyrin repeats (3 copies)
MPQDQPEALQPASARRHDLDALRAFAMLLGIVLHAALSFLDDPWLVRDATRAPQLRHVVAAIHGFRMPLFFLLSGFFTAMLWKRRGLRGLLRHRAMRIALPLLLAYGTIAPTMLPISIWAGVSTKDYGIADTGKEIWTAAARGNLDAVRNHLAWGTAIDREDPTFGQSPLSWAVICDQQAVIDTLLDAGADPSARYRDGSTALHTAAFLGRADAATRLLRAGARINATNDFGETPLDTLRHDQRTTAFIAGLLQTSIDFEDVSEGRSRIRQMLTERGALSGLEHPREVAAIEGNVLRSTQENLELGMVGKLLHRLLFTEFFLHLWFLWFLCWLVAGFSLVVLLLRCLPRLPVPSMLIASPLCLLWLVPLTMLTQSSMHQGGSMPGFGPDLSAGILPIPHVLAHHAIFFGFGAVLYTRLGAAARLGRGWWIQLPLALLLLPLALALALHTPWGRGLLESAATLRLLATLGQSLYVWLMIFGLIGLCQAVLSRERPWIRYVSDSSYWLYIVHLPLIMIGQILLRDAELPAIVKLAINVGVSTAVLLLSYHFLVRYTWIGRLLNGPRIRPSRP